MSKVMVRIDVEGEDVAVVRKAVTRRDEMTARELFIFAAERLLTKARTEEDVTLYEGYGFHLQFDINVREEDPP